MNHTSLHRVSAYSLACLLVTIGLAQTASNKDEIVVLDPFTVSAAPSRGYVTTSALSASRVAVPITDLNSSVVVVNERLIEDTMASSLRDTLNLFSGITHGNAGTGSQEQNAFSMRGYTTATAQRDGVNDILMTVSGGLDYSLFDRIELVKGPSGVLYGTHSPGGIVNLISKRPLLKPKSKLSVSAGSYASYRVDVDHSGLAGEGERFGYRISAATANTDGPNGYDLVEPSKGIVTINPSLSYTTRNGLYLWAWGAYVRDSIGRTMPTVHAFATSTVNDPVTGVRNAGAPFFGLLTNSNVMKNYNEVNSDVYEIGASKSQKLGPVTADVRVLWRNYQQDSIADRVRGNSGVGGITTDEFIDSTGARIGVDNRAIDFGTALSRLTEVSRPVIRYDQRPTITEGDTFAADLNLSFNVGPTSHKLLAYATLDDVKVRSENNVYDIRSTATLATLGVPLVNGVARVPLTPRRTLAVTREQVLNLADFRAIGATVITDGTTKSYGAIERLSFLENRFIITGGVRRTELDIQTTSSTLTSTTKSTALTKKGTSAYGALVKLYRGTKGEFSVYYNDNETFTPVTTIDRRVNISAGVSNPNFNKRYPDRTATNSEWGFKADLLDSRLVATAAVFKTVEDNVLLGLPDIDGSITGIINQVYQVPGGTRTTKGWELDVNYNPVPEWEFIASYSDIDPVLENGRYAPAVPFSTASLAARYERTQGALKGFSLLWMFTHWGQSSLGSRTYWLLPSGDTHVAVLGFAKGPWNVRLRIENVFDDISAYPSEFDTAIGVTRGRNYRLGLTYTF